MPRIRVAVDQAMADVSDAADAAENAAKWATAIMERAWKHGVDLDLKLPEETRQKLEGIWQVGPIILKLLDALDGLEINVHLGTPQTQSPQASTESRS